MKKTLSYISIILALAACSKVQEPVHDYTGTVELAGVEAELAGSLSTKATALDADYYVGRSEFVNQDYMVLTTIKRTVSPIEGFTYSGIKYRQDIEAGQTSGGWTRIEGEGKTASSGTAPDRIYWSDATNGHTYIGYSVPQGTFDWVLPDGTSTYYGSLGDPTASGYLDHTSNDNIKADDILLTYDTEKVAETGGSVAKLYFHHGLAMVRVIVNIQGFSASSDAADSKSVVSDMVIKDMLTLYKWKQLSYEAEALTNQDDAAAIYGAGVNYNQTKDLHTWIPRPAGTGTGIGKQFTFYGLAVPTTMTALGFHFTVTYPKPMNPDETETHTYSATMSSAVEFRAGCCTTINVSLDHSNENITVGAEYMDWQYVETPDQGELKKGSNMLTTTDPSSVTIAGDTNATEDDATWLYVSGKDASNNDIVVDIYGNDGTQSNPYTICNAEQLLSFAYEVKKNGRTFQGQYVKLDCNIVMQKNVTSTTDLLDWIGIGDATHYFDGWFDGGVRHITRLKGSPFFHTIGPNAHIDQLIIESSAGDITGSGGFAEFNKGTLCACKFNGSLNSTLSGTDNYVGGFVGWNQGNIIACVHLGTITASCNVGGFAGKNSGVIVASYSAGAESSGASCKVGGITAYQYTYAEWMSLDSSNRSKFGTKVMHSFYDSSLLTPSYTDGAIGKNTDSMQLSNFVGSVLPSAATSLESFGEGTDLNADHSLNFWIYQWVNANRVVSDKTVLDDAAAAHFLQRYYVYQPASYPLVY